MYSLKCFLRSVTSCKSRFSFSTKSGASAVGGFVRKCKTDLLALFCCLVSVSFADLPTGGNWQCVPNDNGGYDCYCCGCNTGGNEGEILTNETASGCVKMSPESCEALRSSILTELTNINDSASSAFAFLDDTTNITAILLSSREDIWNSLFSAYSNLTYMIDNPLSVDLSAFDSVVSSINDSLVQCHYVLGRVNPVEGSPKYGTVVYTNLVSGVFYSVTRVEGFLGTRLSRATNYIHSAISSLSSARSTVENQVTNYTDRLSVSLYSARNSVDSALSSFADYDDFLESINYNVDLTRQQLDSITNSTSLLESNVTMQMNCEACRGSGGGDAGNVDLTAVIAAINNLSDRLDYFMTRLLNLLQRFYSDYDAAADLFLSGAEPTMAGYLAQGDNWFKRVEYLLYATAYSALSNGLDNADEPEIDNVTQYDDTSDTLQDAADDVQQSLTDSVSSSWQDFSQSVRGLLTNLLGFERPQRSLNGVVLFSHGNTTTPGHWELATGDDVESDSNIVGYSLSRLSYGMRVLWSLLSFGLYALTVVFYVRFLCRVVSGMLQVMASTFGG